MEGEVEELPQMLNPAPCTWLLAWGLHSGYGGGNNVAGGRQRIKVIRATDTIY